MSAISNYLERAWLRTLRGGGNGTSYTAPSAIYVKLHTGAPGEDGTSNASANTTRQSVTFDDADATAGTMTSSGAASWTNWASGSETISHISLWDASSTGNCLWTGALTSSKAVANGDTLTIPAGSLTLTLA